MTALHQIEPGTFVGLSRGDVAICIPVYGAVPLFVRCLDSVLAHTPAAVAVLVADDCSSESNIAPLVAERIMGLARQVYYTRNPRNLGFVANVNGCFDMTAPADVVILNSDCEVTSHWYDDLRAAAYSDTTIATATPLTNQGALVSVPERNVGRPVLPSGWTLETAAAAIRAASQRLRPHLPTLIGHCAYIKRSALELVGGFDLAFSPGYGEEVDFSQRCLLRGLAHVVADDVFVLHHGSASFATDDRSRRFQHEHELLIGRRYPYYHDAVRAAARGQSSPLARSISTARRALRGLSVTIDGSCFASALTGTQVQTLEVILALHRAGKADLRVAVPSRCTRYVRGILEGLEGLEVIDIDRVDEHTSRSDVVHRPYQVGRFHEMVRLRHLGERVVVTQQDFIAYRNPGYSDSFQEWYRYRALARVALAQAERVVFFSQHAACEAVTEGLVEEDRSRVVYIGVDHRHTRDADKPRRPALPASVESNGFLLCLGVDFMHKNRGFALRILEQLQTRHRWPGHLVLAGPQASPGSSAEEDYAFLRGHEEVAAVTTILGNVSEEEKWWLLANASLVVAPSTYEGFGLIPFEASQVGTPCLFARQASLAEVLPVESALIEPWDAAGTADRAIHLITDCAAALHLVSTIQEAAMKYRWDHTATELLKVYAEAATATPRDLIVELAASAHTGRYGTQLQEPTVEFAKVLRFWRAYGFVRGSWRGSRALAGRVRRRVRSARGTLSSRQP